MGNNKALTPQETEQTLSDLAGKLEEMDKAEGFFGESMAEALTDDYLEEVIGGLAALPVTTPGYKVCVRCGCDFFMGDIDQYLCNDCKKEIDREP